MSTTAHASDVLAVVLTHNAPDALERCLLAIAGQSRQPSAVLVVDNASREPARVSQPLGAAPVTVLRLEENTGPAGGHASGLQAFLDGGYGFAWVMDDDCVADRDCLRRLVEHAEGLSAPSLLFPTWVDEASGCVTNYPAWCGFLMPRSIVAAVGLPRSEFFWWAEDTEYLHWRIPQAGHAVDRVPDAVVHHARVRATARKPDWKIYYEVRNSVYFRLWVQRGRWQRFPRLARTLGRTLARIVVKEDRRLPKLALYGRGLHDGVRGRLGKQVEATAREQRRAVDRAA